MPSRVWEKPKGQGWVLEKEFVSDALVDILIKQLKRNKPNREYVVTGEYVGRRWFNVIWSRPKKKRKTANDFWL